MSQRRRDDLLPLVFGRRRCWRCSLIQLLQIHHMNSRHLLLVAKDWMMGNTSVNDKDLFLHSVSALQRVCVKLVITG